MITHGADTMHLRAHADRSARCAQAMLARTSSLTATVLATTWEGPDAVGFRERWARLENSLRAVAGDVERRGRELIAHAEEQDLASAPSSDGPVGGVGLGLALGALGEAGRARSAGAVSDAIGLDDFDHERGGDGRESTMTLTLPDGTEIEVSSDGESESFSMNTPLTFEQEVEADGLEVSHTIEIGSEFEVTVNEDGSLTYTFTGTSTQSLEAEAESKRLEISAGQSVTSESLYSVRVPAGTSVEEAMLINPFNPASIPDGASITIGSGVEASSSLEAEGTFRGVEVGLGLETSAGTEMNSVITRGEDGNLSLLTGPTDMVGQDYTVSVGVGDAALELGISRDQEHGVLEYVEFSPDDAGNAAYAQTLWSEGYPADTSLDGVEDRYTQTHTNTAMDSSWGLEIEDIFEFGASHNTFADELIVRTYPDGGSQWAQQVLPHGESSSNSVLVTGATGTETSYQMTLGDVQAGGSGDVFETYWGESFGGGELRVAFTPQELALMAENRAASFRNPDQYSDATDYLSSVVATASGQDGAMVMQDLFRDYNYRPDSDGSWNGAEPVHDDLMPPGTIR